MIYLDYLLLSFKTDRKVDIGPCWVSNIVSEEYNRCFPPTPAPKQYLPDETSISNHVYFYPRLQYKVVRNSPMIASIVEGCNLLWNLYDRFGQNNGNFAEWKITERRLIDRKAPFGLTEEYKKYRFLTPWLCLPEEEFKGYLTIDESARERMLRNIIEGHIKSMADSLGYKMGGRLRTRIIIKPNYIFQRDIHYAGMLGSFIANFEIPNFLGIGKSVSRGFGTIKQV